MTLYHMSQTLILGEEMKNDFEKKSGLTLPFVYALEKSIDSFCDMTANGQSQRTAPDKLICLERTEYVKWCVEGAFEFIRKMEFPNCRSRMNCKYFLTALKTSKSSMGQGGNRNLKKNGQKSTYMKLN